MDAPRPASADYDAAFLAASLHIGRYQPALVDYALRHHAVLNAMRSAFISVSLSAAGVDRRDWGGLAQCLERFQHDTMWRPDAVYQAAGAIRYRQYGLITRLAIWFIARSRGQRTALSRDYDFTAYGALQNFVLDFIRGGPAGASPSSRETTDG